MGSYSELYISDYPIFTAKNSYYEEIVNLFFLDSDFQEFERPLNERNEIYWGDAYSEEEGVETIKAFRSTAGICKDRLELFGASYEKAKLDFENTIELMKEDDIYDFVSTQKITYEQYLDTLKEIISSINIHQTLILTRTLEITFKNMNS